MVKCIITLFAVLLFSLALCAQDIHFSQFAETPLYRNPALAGIYNGDYRIQTAFRSQWNSVANAYKTSSVNAEYRMKLGRYNDYITSGIQLFQDHAGTIDLTTTNVLPVLNYHKSLSSNRSVYLSLGFMGGLVQRRFDRSKMTTNNQFEGRGEDEPIQQNLYRYIDGSVGMSLNANFGNKPDNNFILGASYHHINHPKNSFTKANNIILDPRYVFSGSLKFGITVATVLTMQADHVQQGRYQETIAGILYGYKIGNDYDRPDYIFSGGAYIRWNDALVPTLKLNYSSIAVALSYDVNISKLRASTYGRGGFEIAITYTGLFSQDQAVLNKLICPRF